MSAVRHNDRNDSSTSGLRNSRAASFRAAAADTLASSAISRAAISPVARKRR
jgi:hypothetical protein